ncbi:MAG: DNA methylase [Betaproteobacteria bacterium RIFCSPLOWO2_12_FULL_62_13]|nr:MAG: DNA methylase [Betaproteobacteria bacterium RIFCSPLOWO2_12_FULL_62_13]
MPTLDWLDREHAMRRADEVPYRLLEQVSSHGNASAGNLLIQGDNLEALKALLPFYRGRVKCIYIDPPYNTKSAFEHYDDNLEHSQWLSMMHPRLVLLRELLADNGSIWVSIDDNEGHYLKVLMDEVFGRRFFLAEIIWQKRTSRENRAAIGSSHDEILAYAKVEAQQWKEFRNLLSATGKGYSNPDNDPRGPWRSIPFSAQGFRPNQMYRIFAPNGAPHDPPRGRCWAATEPEYLKLVAEKRIYFPKDGAGRPRVKQFRENEKGLVPMTLWFASEVGDTEESKKEILSLFADSDPFETPKPERLIQRVLQIATNKSDLVVDSFLGSGTTVAVAHKMGRRYIGIEMGEHAVTHCLPRLKKVIEGEQGGISEAVGWKGGGGFKFAKLGETIFDERGAINPKVRFATLASFIWLQETGVPSDGEFRSPLLGKRNGTAYYLLFNGILGDKRPDGGNVLTAAVLNRIDKRFPHEGTKVIYGESCRLGSGRLKAAGVTFKHIPYDVRAK